MSKVTIATAPCSWGVWYADGTPSGTPWNVFLDQAAAAGYKALELGPDGYLPTDEDVLREELTRRGLDVCSGTCCYQDVYKRQLPGRAFSTGISQKKFDFPTKFPDARA